MDINWTEVIISICSIIITGVLIPLINSKRKEANESLTKEQLATIKYWTEVGVRWAKQWLQSESGEKKKEEVLLFLSIKLASLNIEVTEEDLDKIIEAIYGEIKDSLS